MIEQLLLETFFGALTGYVTNDVAIKGLFKKGGVVEKTRDEFIHEASALLEEQVLTQEVLRERLTLESVEAAMEELLRHFFRRELPEVLAPLKLGDMAGYEELWQQAASELASVWQRESPALAELLSEQLALGELLPAKQCAHLSGELLKVVQQELTEGRYGERFLKRWLAEAGDMNGAELGLAEVAEAAADQVVHVLDTWLEELLATQAAQVQELLLATLERLALPELLAELEQALRVRPLGDLCQEDGAAIAERLAEALCGPRGEELCNKLSSRLLQAAAGMEQPLSQWVGAEAKALVLPFVRQQLPEILTRLINWLRANEAALNELIEEAIDETILQAGDFKSMALLMVRDSVLEGLFSEHVIMDKVDEFLQTQMSAEELAGELTDKLLAYGGQMSPAKLLAWLGGAQGPLHRIVRDLLRENLLSYVRDRLPEQLEGWLAQPIGRWLPEDLAEQYGQTVLVKAAGYLMEGLRSEALKLAAARALKRLAEEFTAKPLKETVTGYAQHIDDWAAKGEQLLEAQLDRLQFPLEQWAAKLGDPALFTALLAQGERFVPRALDKLGQRWQQRSLGDLYTGVFTQQWVEDILPACRTFISDKLVEAAAGNLSQLAENSLNKLSNEEILKLVQDFMGRELKPLNYLGAVLGGLVGIVTGALVAGPLGAVTAGQAGSLTALAAGRSAVYGAVGYGTNCAAIKGLFWPYKPVAGVRALQGVVPKQQERFANSLGQMVDRYVLNEDILQEILVGQNERWQAMGTALASNTVAAGDILSQMTAEQEKIVQGSYIGLGHKCGQYLPQLLDKASQQPLSKLLPLDKLAVSVDSERLSGWLAQEAAVFCRSEQPLAQFVSAGQLIAPAGTFAAEQLPQLWYGPLTSWQALYADWQKRPLAEVLPAQSQAALQNWLNAKLEQVSQQESVVRYVTTLLNRFLSEQTLGEAFDGQLSRWLAANLSSLLQTALNEVIGWLAAKQETITSLVQKQIRERLSFMQLMGYAAVGGDELVGEMVERLVTVKLPLFLAIRQQEIGQAVKTYWEERLAPLSPAELALVVTPEAVASFLGQLAEQPLLRQEAAGFLADAGLILGRVPVSHYLAPTIFGDLGTLETALAAEKVLVTSWLDAHWQQKQGEILFHAARVLEPFLNAQLSKMTVGALLAPCAAALGRLDSERLLALGGLEPLAKEALAGIMLRAGQRPASAWLDWPEFSAQLMSQGEKLLASDAFKDWWQKLMTDLLGEAPRLWEEVLPKKMREQLTSWVVQAFLASLRQDGSSVLRQMNLAQVTSVQVQAMDARELEQLVHGFAQPYFDHIQNMGWLGAGFAIPGILLSFWLL